MEEVSVTLEDIKNYCEANNIILDKREDPSVVSNIQAFGDVSAEAYFMFYLKNKEAIDEWVINNSLELPHKRI